MEAYLDNANSLKVISRNFVRRKGGDIEEAESEANLGFMDAVRTYKKRSGPFDKWLRSKVYYALFASLRHKLSQRIHRPHIQAEMDDMPLSAIRFSLPDLKSSVSQNSGFIINLVVMQPRDIWERTRLIDNGTNRRLRKAIKEYVLALGWPLKEVHSCFDEIRQALEKQ